MGGAGRGGMGGAGRGGAGQGGVGRGDLDLDLVADLKAHRTPWGSTMASSTTLHIGRPCHVRCTPQALDGPPWHANSGAAGLRWQGGLGRAGRGGAGRGGAGQV